MAVHHTGTVEVVLPCPELEPSLDFFVERLGFRLESIFPADAPRVAIISREGLRLRLEPGDRGKETVVRIVGETDSDPQTLTAPNGTRVEIVPARVAPVVPALCPSFEVARLENGDGWRRGRAGMAYRDLIPSRQGGRYIASHIRIPRGGPVPDYVHYHRVCFQLIYCLTGWVEVVYEDMGPPLVMRAGDCVLQPPTIRHRVLTCSDGLEVVEISCPAEHETHADHELALPTGALRPERRFAEQYFVHHRAEGAVWRREESGELMRDLGLASASVGLVDARVIRLGETARRGRATHEHDLFFGFVTAGALVLESEGRVALEPGDAFTVPAGMPYAMKSTDSETEILLCRSGGVEDRA